MNPKNKATCTGMVIPLSPDYSIASSNF